MNVILLYYKKKLEKILNISTCDHFGIRLKIYVFTEEIGSPEQNERGVSEAFRVCVCAGVRNTFTAACVHQEKESACAKETECV